MMENATGKTLLLTDDDKYNIYAMLEVLDGYGLTIITAGTGKEAIEKLHQNHVDIILMDIMMPEMDGFEAMKIIRSDAKFKETPILALTAKAMKGDSEKCIEAGANDYLTKPIDIDILLTMINKYLA